MKNIISPNNEHVGYCEFSNDGSELYYTLTTDKWFPTKLLKVSSDNLYKKDTLNLIGSDFEGEPTLNSRIGDILTFIKKNYPDVKTIVRWYYL